MFMQSMQEVVRLSYFYTVRIVCYIASVDTTKYSGLESTLLLVNSCKLSQTQHLWADV